MYEKKQLLIMVFILLLLSVWVGSSLAETPLQYQSRGNRYEGIKPKPVAGEDVELISALVDYKEKGKRMPDQLKVRFYVKKPIDIYLTVRELDYKYYYWMDKIRPSRPWRSGFVNIFKWPTSEVIQQLDDLQVYDLGVIARLKKPEPSKVEHVTPVIFYHSRFPYTIKGYLFTFRTNGDARLSCSFYKKGEAVPLFTQIFRRQRGGRPFTVRWDSTKATEGSYKLVVSGYFLDTNDPIDQTVHFYHRPNVK